MEGLRIATKDTSDDDDDEDHYDDNDAWNNPHEGFQCTSHPLGIQMLEIWQEAIIEASRASSSGGNHGDEDNRFTQAAKHVEKTLNHMSNKDLPTGMNDNKRTLSSAMSIAMNIVLDSGFTVSHEPCIGPDPWTQANLSAMRLTGNGWPPTLLVGQGQLQQVGKKNLRRETRGQLLNQLQRHRLLDQQFGVNDYSPVLLLAFDNLSVEVDLAFPCKKGGKLERDGVVQFQERVRWGTETFATLRLLCVSLSCDGSNDEDGERTKNLSALLRFLSKALETLSTTTQKKRVQFKIPFPLQLDDMSDVVSVRTKGPYVTIIEHAPGEAYVYKEFCYYLRDESSEWSRMPLAEIRQKKKKDQRLPPPEKLLEVLGAPYCTEWKLFTGPFGVSVLRYPWIEGAWHKASVNGWLMILDQIRRMHSIGLVHGDLLPRNLVFQDDSGYVIDFDFAREAGEDYIHDFRREGGLEAFRHPDAEGSRPMKKIHDLHSLRQISTYLFDLSPAECEEIDRCDSLEDLSQWFQQHPDINVVSFDLSEEEEP